MESRESQRINKYPSFGVQKSLEKRGKSSSFIPHESGSGVGWDIQSSQEDESFLPPVNNPSHTSRFSSKESDLVKSEMKKDNSQRTGD